MRVLLEHPRVSLLCGLQKQESVEIIDSEPHRSMTRVQKLWSRRNSQIIWEKSTARPWPDISIGLIRGAAAIAFENNHTKGSEWLRILISMTIWAIWIMDIKDQKHNKQPRRSTGSSEQYTKGTHPRSDEKEPERDAFPRRRQEDDSTACSTDPLDRWTPD